LQFAPKHQCDHYAYAWKEPKSQEQEDAEDMQWDVPDFLRTYLVARRTKEGIDPRITVSFITYIYGEACCTELRDARHTMNEWWDEKGY